MDQNLAIIVIYAIIRRTWLSDVVRKKESNLATFLRFCSSLIDLLNLLATKSFTSSPVMIYIKHQSFEYKTLCIYVKDPFKSKYQLLINGREKVGIEHFKNPRAFIDYSRIIDDVYENFKDYNPSVNIVWWYHSRYGV